MFYIEKQVKDKNIRKIGEFAISFARIIEKIDRQKEQNKKQSKEIKKS